MDVYMHGTSEVAYTRTGSGAPVVLLHNGGMSHVIWRDVVPALAARHEVFALDLPGFGASAAPDDHGLAHYVEVVEGFLDALGLQRVAMVGNCMGSTIATAVAERRSRSVSALVLINPLTHRTFAAGAWGSALELSRSFPTLSWPIIETLRRMSIPQSMTGKSMRLQLGRRGRSAGLDRDEALRACYRAPGSVGALIGIFEDMESYRFLDQLTLPPGFPPITTVWGTSNRVLSARAGRKLADRLRPVRQVWLDGCGHLPMLEAPDEVATVIAEAIDAAAIDDSALPVVTPRGGVQPADLARSVS